MSDRVRLRSATWTLDREQLLAIRHQVFVTEQGVPLELEEDPSDPLALHLLALDPQDTPIATGRLLGDGHIGRMAVLRPWRGQGVGRRLLLDLIQSAADLGLQQVFLNAQCEAQGFYAGLGFQPEGEIFYDAGIPHIRMTRPVK